MTTLATVLRYELIIFLAALALLLGHRMLTQQINMKGLLMDKTGGRAISPGRVQMLLVTMGIAAYYFTLVVETKDKSRLPDLPNELVVMFGASHGTYLLGKLYGRFATTLGLASPKIADRFKPKEGKTSK